MTTNSTPNQFDHCDGHSWFGVVNILSGHRTFVITDYMYKTLLTTSLFVCCTLWSKQF
jgi:hypothetical protein